MQTWGKYDIEKLLFRRQFILGPHFVEELTSWRRISVRSTICLTVHPDLNIYQAVHKNKSITLLGYVLDPNKPQANDPDIINGLIHEFDTCDSLDNFFEHTCTFGGRWILIVDNGKEIRLFNDAAGYRQVFYTNPSSSQDIWCASQPGLIAEILHLEMDGEALEFINSHREKDKEYWWPGDSSPYKEISHLLPNHYLDLKTGLPHRYWPNRNLDPLSLEEAVRRNSKILQGLMKSACNRFDLALSLTAGRDTRLLLAASKEIRARLFCFTLTYWDLSENSPDIEIPSRLLAKLGLKHHIIRCPPCMEDEFRKIYERNVATAHNVYGTIAQGLYDHYPQDKVCIKGNAIPIAKCHYRYKLHKLTEADRREITGLTLARLTRKEKSPFAIRALEKWLSGSRGMYNVSILDLFWWEDREANWQAMSQLEWDIVQEVLVPYNCRTFITNMLSVDEKHRKPPEYELHRALMMNLWPEVLSEPINPHKKKTIKSATKEFLRRMGHKTRFGKWWWWMLVTMRLSDLPYLGRFFTWLAGLPLGPYRKKWPLARITSKSYISPKAQIGCPDLQVGQRCFIDDFVTITSGTGGGSVILGGGVYLYRGTIIEVNRGAKVIIGEGTHIQANCILNGLLDNLWIGRNVMIAPHCGFFSYQHKIDDLSQPMNRQGLTSKGDIVIEDDVWLGMGVKVMDGVRIGRGAVIGANAVVTQDIPPYSMAAGIPAHVIRRRDLEKPSDAI